MSRSNEYADDVNAVKSHLEKNGDKGFMPNFDFNFDATTNTDLKLTPTAGHDHPALRYFKYTVQDDSGNEAKAAHDMANATTKAAQITIDCSGLKVRDKWRIIVKAGLSDSDKTERSRHVDLLEGEVYQLQASNAVQNAWVTP